MLFNNDDDCSLIDKKKQKDPSAPKNLNFRISKNQKKIYIFPFLVFGYYYYYYISYDRSFGIKTKIPPSCKFGGKFKKKRNIHLPPRKKKTMKDVQLPIKKKRKILIPNEDKEEKEEKEDVCSLCGTEFLPLCINCKTCKTMCEKCYKTKSDYGVMNEWGLSCPYRWGDGLFWDGCCHNCGEYTFAERAKDASCTFCDSHHCKECLTEFREVTDSNSRIFYKMNKNLQKACPDCMEEFEYLGVWKKTINLCYVKKTTMTPTTTTPT